MKDIFTDLQELKEIKYPVIGRIIDYLNEKGHV